MGRSKGVQSKPALERVKQSPKAQQARKRGRHPQIQNGDPEADHDASNLENVKDLSLDDKIDPALSLEQPLSKRPKQATGRSSVILASGKPLFSKQALRSNFNPLPQTLLDYSSNDQANISPRCGNKLNSMKIVKHEWLNHLSKIDNQFLLIFGAGDMGQMGLGSERLDDVRKPTIHAMIEELRSQNQFTTPVHVAGGGMHTLVIDSDGRIWSWGINDNAALGRQTEGIDGVEQEELETRPKPVLNLSPTSEPDSNRAPFKAARVSAGDSVSVAISEQGEAVAWGSFRSNDGLLGFDGNVGTSPKQLVPSRVSNLSGYPVSQVVCGYDHVLALTTDGHVYSWGNGQQQQLGRKIIERRKKNGLTPERLSLKKIVLVGTGGSHSFAINEAGTVYGWGLNTRGQLGISSEETGWEDEIVSIPTPIRAMSPDLHDGARVVAVEGGDFHTLFLLSNGEVWAVGNYENGEIGIKSSAPEVVAHEKARIEGVSKKAAFVEEEIQKRKARFEKTLAKYNDRIQAQNGRIVNGDMHDDDQAPPTWDEMMERLEVEQEAANLGLVPGKCLRTPVRVEFPHPIIDISCGTRHNLAVDNQGNAYSWGLGQSNELGQGKDEDGEEIELLESPKLLTSKALSQPTSSGGSLKVIRCAAGGTHSLLIASHVIESKTNGSA